ncbi:MAG: hypothetical protein M3409_08735, partial [Gemmatimonadota bacterium]|nr:hypothetical protein [Gemmatimonadota bacterium]
YESADQLFRFNRVEGAFLGVGAILEPRDPDARWQLFGTGGWAFAEGTARGELQARLRAPRRGGWGASAGAYRRLRDLQPFRPAWESRWIHTLSAALGGYDLRDYLDAAGVEAGIAARRGPWTLGGGVRIERQDSVVRNTGRFLLGEARDFPTLAPVEPGVHAALEGELRFGRGPGAMSLGNSTLAAVRGEVGAGDFRIARLTGLLSARRDLGPATLATRLDAGHVFGGGAAVPPQLLFRFGGTEGLRGYPHNAFAGSSALLGRGRLLVHLPPRRNQPLARSGIFIIPPLRPALVLSGDAGWTAAAGAPGTPLLRGKATETDGVRTSLGIGISVFDDALSAEWVRPDDGRTGRWYVGLVRWF